jgi:hypothetical protein
MNHSREPGFKRIFIFWSPLAMTWLMMACEGPFLAAVVARLAEPKANLAAYGVSFAIAILIEAPIIMIMSASTALAVDRVSFLKLRNFTYALNAFITLVLAVLLFTPGMDYLTRSLIGLPDRVADLTYTSLIILLPWPGAIGYRRFYQGLLIRGGQTRRVAYGTVVRLSSMTLTGIILYNGWDLPGACVAASALSVGVVCEAVAARIMAIQQVRRLKAEANGKTEEIRYRGIAKFYYPLALTSTISLAVHPMVSFFVGQGRFPLESLAVIPVVNSLTFLFRSLGLSYQEAVIALLGERLENYRSLRNFAVVLGLSASLALGLIAFTPLSGVWFEDISGLDAELADFAVLPAMIMTAFPFTAVWLSLQRGLLVKAQRTPPITAATVIEVAGILGLLYLTIECMDMVGAVAAALSLLLGRIAGNLYLVRPCSKAIRDKA